MALGMEVGLGLGPGHIVLDGDPVTHLPSPKRRQSSPNFRPMSIVAKRLECWMDQDASWYGDRPRPGDIVLDG